jgi:hypothetical protein
MGRRRVVLEAWVTALLVASCSSPKSNAKHQAALDACAQLNQASAQAWVACYGGPVDEWQAYLDQAAPCERYAHDVDDGSVVLNSDAIPGCLSAIQSAPCYAPAQCEYTQVFVGQAPDGTPCASDTSICGPLSFCPTYDCNPTCQPNTGAAVGQACGAGVGCQYGVFCDVSKNLCFAPAPEGGTCGGISALPCAPGLYCSVPSMFPISASSTPYSTCIPFSTGPCDVDSSCPPGQFCQQQTCVPLRALGAPCSDAPTACAGFSSCDQTSTRPTCVHAGQPGEPCAPIDGVPAICSAAGTICGPNFTCIPKPQLGQACSGPTCADGLYCNGTCMQCPTPDGGQP